MMKRVVPALAVAALVAAGVGVTPSTATSAEGDKPLIALTFDDGPSKKMTSYVLRVLDKKDVPATFFLVGRNVVDEPKLVKQIAQDGHVIGNHSWSHPDFTTISAAQAEQEIMATNQAIRQITGRTPVLFRYPYGKESEAGNAIIRREGMWGGVLWHWDTPNQGDFECPGAAGVQAYIEAEATDQAVILLHDAMDVLDCDKKQWDYLPRVIDDLRAKGFEFGVVVPAMQGSPVNQWSWVEVVPAIEESSR